jgi:hypothetical protein
MKRSWLIGAALVFSLSAVACSDDDDSDTVVKTDAGTTVKLPDGGSVTVVPDGGLDGGSSIDAGHDAATTAPDAGDAGK